MILSAAGITYLMGDIARGHETIARLENEDLASDDDLQFPGQDIVRFILARVHVTGHADSWRQTRLDEAVPSSGISARQNHGPDADIKIIAFRSRLMFDGWSFVN